MPSGIPWPRWWCTFMHGSIPNPAPGYVPDGFSGHVLGTFNGGLAYLSVVLLGRPLDGSGSQEHREAYLLGELQDKKPWQL